MPPKTEAEARSSAGGGGGGGGGGGAVPNFEDREGKLKHQQDKIDQQKTRIEILEAKVKKQEAHLFQWRKYPQEMHASLSHKPARKSEPEGLSGSVKKAKRQAEQIASAAREAYTYTPEYCSIVHAERVLYPDYPDDAGAGN